MSLVMDASALVKIVIEEEMSREARRVLREALASGYEVNVPEIALAEVLNALWRHRVLIQDLSEEEFKGALEDVLILWSKLSVHKTYMLARQAIDIAVKHRITVYDALYLALAAITNSVLLTFDKELKRIAEELGITTSPETM